MNTLPDFAKLLHNLRNQLNNISMNAELARLELDSASQTADPASDSTTAMECLDTIVDACRKCAEIADALNSSPTIAKKESPAPGETREH